MDASLRSVPFLLCLLSKWTLCGCHARLLCAFPLSVFFLECRSVTCGALADRHLAFDVHGAADPLSL